MNRNLFSVLTKYSIEQLWQHLYYPDIAPLQLLASSRLETIETHRDQCGKETFGDFQNAFKSFTVEALLGKVLSWKGPILKGKGFQCNG